MRGSGVGQCSQAGGGFRFPFTFLGRSDDRLEHIMSARTTEGRWLHAQSHEGYYWISQTTVPLLLQIAHEFAGLPSQLGEETSAALFADKEVLEVGVGPLALSAPSFFPDEYRVKRLVKLDPLPRIALTDTPVSQQTAMHGLLAWLETLAEDGEYVQSPAEQMEFREEF